MSRSTRSRRPPARLIENNVVEIPKIMTKTSKQQIKTTKLHSTKGSNNKLFNTYPSNPLSSPVLRDRTNLIKEPTTKLDVLKKGLANKDAADVKMGVTEERTKRTRAATKLTTNQNRENIQGGAEIKTKKFTTATNKEGKISRIKPRAISTTVISEPNVAVMETLQKDTIKTRGKKNSMTNKITEVKTKLTEAKTKNSINAASKPQLKIIKIQIPDVGVSNDKSKSPSKKKSDKLKVSTKSTVTRKTIGNQSAKRTTRQSKNNVTIKLNNKNEEKKFFKSKLKTPRVVPTHSKISPLKRPTISRTRKAIANQRNANKIPASKLSTSFRLRQPTLHESFANQPKKVLRPRKVTKNYCDQSQVIDKKVNDNKLSNIDEKKGPVYKMKENKDEDNTNKEKVYDFTFDSNDSKERITSKRRKRIVRRQPAKKAKLDIKSSKTKSILSKKLPTEKFNEVSAIIPKPPIKKSNEVNVMKNNDKITTITAEIHLPPAEVSDKDNDEILADQAQEPIKDVETCAGLRIISNEKIPSEHRICLTATPTQPRAHENESIPSHKLNMFNLRPSMQMKTMMNAPLLRKSLSPINSVNAKESLETGSPWRTPVINTFSRVKNVFQSTPQGKQFTNLLGKTALGAEATQKLKGFKLDKIVEKNYENANVSPIKKSPEKNQTNTSKSPRKFGTVISNINNNSPIKQQSLQINTSKSPRKFGTVISNINETLSKTPIIPNERTKFPSNIQQTSIIDDSINTMLPDIDEISQIPDDTLYDKENLAPTKTPRKSLNQRSKTPRTTPPSSENIHPSPESKLTEDVFEPQPGPSGLQKQSPLTDTWNLKQSNLNKFLNLPDMPNSTRISTAHGIFSDDNVSIPIIGKTVKKITTEIPDVNNAFGFDNDDDDDDDDDNIEVSPINKIHKELKTELIPTENKLNNKPPTVEQPLRFSVNEIKKTLLPSKQIEKKPIDEKQEKNNVPLTNDKSVSTVKKDVIQAIDFSDTFDNIDHEVDDENIKEVPLFVDTEPVHFTQPPRYSYGHKRKRNVSFSTSGELEDDEIDDDHKLKKKKKIGKVEREQKKKLDQWAKSMNNTFEEIDHFDLLVE